MAFVHEDRDFSELVRIVVGETALSPGNYSALNPDDCDDNNIAVTACVRGPSRCVFGLCI